jgi:DnaJ-class molecular chaperone
MSGSKSLYDILGVSRTDTCTDIRKAYLKLARTHHPDKGGSPDRFKEIQRASEILTDEKRRKAYDDFGVIDGDGPQDMFNSQGPNFPFPFEVNLNDLFGSMFGNPPVGRGQPVRRGKKPGPVVQTINLTLEQFYLGHNFDININRQCFCGSCDHTGAKSKETCGNCRGRGAVTQVVQMGPMAMHTTGPCLECQGKGEKVLIACDKCSGTGFTSEKRTLSVKIQPGTRTGETYIFNEVCSDNPAFERPADAHIIIGEDSNDPAFKYFTRTGDRLQNLETTVLLSLSESLMGCVLQVDGHPGYDDGLFLQIPPGSFHNDRFCLTGFGMPVLGDIGKYGDLFITIDVSIKPMERKLFSTKGRELLSSLFEDKVRTTECSADAIQKDLFLVK